MTGRDRINQMSNDEFIKGFVDDQCPSDYGLVTSEYNFVKDKERGFAYCAGDCYECWLNALESEIED